MAPRVGIHGVHLRKWEEVVADILSSSLKRPSYLPLPPLPDDEVRRKLSSWCGEAEGGGGEEGVNTAEESSGSEATGEGGTGLGTSSTSMPPPEWPFDILPPAACVRGPDRRAGNLSGPRAVRKEAQLRSILRCVLAMLPLSVFGHVFEDEKDDCDTEDDTGSRRREKKRFRIVDFAGGTGHLAVPLALLLPRCEVVLVDLKATSLELVHLKAERHRLWATGEVLAPATRTAVERGPSGKVDVTHHSRELTRCRGIPNLYTYHGSISSYRDQFDIGVSLHACGEASDLVLRSCGRAGASFVVSPCCVGKLNRRKANPYVYHATAGNDPTVSYPQSRAFRMLGRKEGEGEGERVLLTPGMFDELAKAADYSVMQDMRTCRNASRRVAKSLLELDRLTFMTEQYGYGRVGGGLALTRMDPWEASPKNDILLGWFDSEGDVDGRIRSPYWMWGGAASCSPCSECNADVEMAVRHLVNRAINGAGVDTSVAASSIGEYTLAVLCTDKVLSGDSVDWSRGEEEDTFRALQDFVDSAPDVQQERVVLRFPTGMGARRRKLVHYVAEQLGLAHWCEGKKDSEKIVAVAKKRIKNVKVDMQQL